MKITKAQINNALSNYISLPTKRRDVMTYTVQMLAKQSVKEFFSKYNQEEFPSGTEFLVLVRDWIAQSQWSPNKKYKIIQMFMNILRDQYIVEQSVAADLVSRFKIKRRINWSEKALSQSDLATLFKSIENNCTEFHDLRCGTALAFMLFSGTRLQAALHAKNYTLTKTHLSVYIQRQKSKVIEDIPKAIPLNIVMPGGTPFRNLITNYIKQKDKKCYPSSYLFTGRGDNPLAAASIRAYIKKLNLPFHLTPHKLRHTAGTMVAQRVGVLEATRLLDHSSIATTQLYIQKYSGDSSETIHKVWSGQPDVNDNEQSHLPSRIAIDAIKKLTFSS